jgi:hypothetical protein
MTHMTQIEMITIQNTVEDTEAMLQNICTFRLNGGCGNGIKNHCFQMVMTDRCSRCRICQTAEEHKKSLLRQ